MGKDIESKISDLEYQIKTLKSEHASDLITTKYDLKFEVRKLKNSLDTEKSIRKLWTSELSSLETKYNALVEAVSVINEIYRLRKDMGLDKDIEAESDSINVICSFCGKSKIETEIIISAYPNRPPNICNECINLCNLIIRESRLEQTEEELEKQETEMSGW